MGGWGDGDNDSIGAERLDDPGTALIQSLSWWWLCGEGVVVVVVVVVAAGLMLMLMLMLMCDAC